MPPPAPPPDPAQAKLSAYLADTDAPCPACGYNLRGLSSDTCPECNQKLAISIGLAEPHIGMLSAAAAGLITGAGGAATVFFLMMLSVLSEGGHITRREAVLLFIIPACIATVEGTLAVQLLIRRGRSWFQRLSDQRRPLVVFLAWLLTIIIGIAWFATLRGLL